MLGSLCLFFLLQAACSTYVFLLLFLFFIYNVFYMENIFHSSFFVPSNAQFIGANEQSRCILSYIIHSAPLTSVAIFHLSYPPPWALPAIPFQLSFVSFLRHFFNNISLSELLNAHMHTHIDFHRNIYCYSFH